MHAFGRAAERDFCPVNTSICELVLDDISLSMTSLLCREHDCS